MKRYKIILYAVCTITFFSTITVISLGFSNHIIYIFELLPLLGKGTANHANQSVNAFFLRLFTNADINIFVLTNTKWYIRMLIMIFVIFMIILVGYTIWRVLSTSRSRSKIDYKENKERLMLSYAMITLTTVLITPISWEHNYISSLMPLVVTMSLAIRRQSL